MAKELEIERKFLVKIPELDALDVTKKVSIIQTYLHRGENDTQRRVRKIEENGSICFTYTEKVFLTPMTREENEREISGEDYERLLAEADTSLVPVEKTRYCFRYKDQLFELDTYPFSDELAIMELEIDSPEQKIILPENVTVLKDVTADSRYSNAALSSAGAFPPDRR